MKVMLRRRGDEDFYSLLGPVFGSREIEKATKDRFYDDPEKVWFLIPGEAVASVSGHTIKNFWASTEEAALCVILEILPLHSSLDGILPTGWEGAFRRCGFTTQYHSKNFFEAHYEKVN